MALLLAGLVLATVLLVVWLRGVEGTKKAIINTIRTIALEVLFQAGRVGTVNIVGLVVLAVVAILLFRPEALARFNYPASDSLVVAVFVFLALLLYLILSASMVQEQQRFPRTRKRR